MAKKHDVLIVRINYRLGPFGWFTHPSIQEFQKGLDRSSNFGTLDIIEALKWVKENTFMDAENYSKWACLRPMTPNMLPVIKRVDRMWVNSGAGHLGWTMGMALAERLSNDLSSR